ncbi:MAG: ATP-binding protein [Velocimicrobium sp.]
MMPELSLNILDVAENSIRANASLVEICVLADTEKDRLTISIKDNGCGMSAEQIKKVEDPFFTTRTTRKVGLGIPFFKQAALGTNGSFHIESKINEGTLVTVTFTLSHIDRMPLGDITSTIHTLITFNTQTDFYYTYTYNKESFSLDTREFREILDGVTLDTPEVSTYIKEYLIENKQDVDHGAFY